MKNKMNESEMEIIIGKILKYGVYLSLFITILGAVLYLYRHGNEHISSVVDVSVFHETDNSFFGYIKNIFIGIRGGHGRAIMSLGIVVLLITPTIRLLFSLIGFAMEKDRMYVIITLIVLTIITLSILGDLG